jgi:RNA polymerase sigma factor (sigma-70 family)
MDRFETKDNDLMLLERCSDGDERALAELHDRHAGLCRRRALEVLRNAALAEEAVQDAFLDLWKTAARFDPARAQVRTWLCVLVHRRAVDLARREARHHAGDDSLPAPDPASYTAEELLILQVDRRRVRTALERLSPHHQQVIELAYWGGLSQSQIAMRCGVPVGTIKSRTFDALTRLATLLAGSEMAERRGPVSGAPAP